MQRINTEHMCVARPYSARLASGVSYTNASPNEYLLTLCQQGKQYFNELTDNKSKEEASREIIMSCGLQAVMTKVAPHKFPEQFLFRSLGIF